MSTKAYQSTAREPWGTLAPACRGTCGYNQAAAQAAAAEVKRQHPEWSERRQQQRALVEMVKRGSNW